MRHLQKNLAERPSYPALAQASACHRPALESTCRVGDGARLREGGTRSVGVGVGVGVAFAFAGRWGEPSNARRPDGRQQPGKESGQITRASTPPPPPKLDKLWTT